MSSPLSKANLSTNVCQVFGLGQLDNYTIISQFMVGANFTLKSSGTCTLIVVWGCAHNVELSKSNYLLHEFASDVTLQENFL